MGLFFADFYKHYPSLDRLGLVKLFPSTTRQPLIFTFLPGLEATILQSGSNRSNHQTNIRTFSQLKLFHLNLNQKIYLRRLIFLDRETFIRLTRNKLSPESNKNGFIVFGAKFLPMVLPRLPDASQMASRWSDFPTTGNALCQTGCTFKKD